MSFMFPQVPRSAATIYGGIVAAVTTIAVSIILFRKLRETGNKSQDKRISKQGHTNTSQPQFIDQDARGEQNVNISIPANHSAGDEGHLGISVASHALPTTSEPQFIDQDARDEQNVNISIPANHSAGDEGHLGISVASHALPTTSELQFIDQDARDEHNFDISIPAQLSTTPQPQPVDHSAGDEGQLGISVPPHAAHAPPTTSEPQFIDQQDKNISIPAQASSTSRPPGDMSEEDPSITLSQGSSKFQISETNATIIRNGDWPLPKIQRDLAWDYITNVSMLRNINYNSKKLVLTQSITTLPRAEAQFNDYQNKKWSGPCFKDTRVALLREMADCVIGSSGTRMYILSGLAGIGKSTVAYTIASRAADLNLLGASFCFSRDEVNRNNAKRFFTTIAYQLCAYNEAFAKAIGDVLKTYGGSAATTKDPEDQLQVLILDPLRGIVQTRSRPTLIVVDALDECNEEDASSVLNGLCKLVQDLPSFKIILTTRPQLYLDRFKGSQDDHKFFHLQDIEDKVVDGDIRVYVNHCLSMGQVQKCFPKRQWCANDEEIDYLVRAAGRLFIIASTAVRYILDKSASNPAAQMQKLLRATAQDHTPLNLDRFYTVILRDVVPEDCDDNDFVSHYKSVVGTIILVQHALPVSTLAHLIGIDVKEIRAVLDNLQSVILLGDGDVPRIYHKSFLEYLTDQARCMDPHLQIDPRICGICHTQIATHCFDIMDKHLKYNILGLGDLARFMSNEDGLKEDGITDEQLEEKIPQQLRYASVYWVNHLEAANTEDVDLVNGLEMFLAKHMLHWFEVLSLVGKLDSAQLAIVVVLKLLSSTSSDFYQLLSDALRFISSFYELIKRSALHTYHSALSFTPRDSLLYHRYIKDAAHNAGICAIEGGPERWDAHVATLSHGKWEPIDIIKFSLAGTLFVSCSPGASKIWAAATGTPISTIPGHRFAVANDFSTVASSGGKTITFYNVNGRATGTIFTAPSNIRELALSSGSIRVAAALSDGTVWLWDSTGNAELIDSLSFDDEFLGKWWSHLQFSPTGTRLAYLSGESIQLRDGISGRFIADLQCGSEFFGSIRQSNILRFEFSGDGSRIASLLDNDRLRLWNSESGALIADVSSVDWCLAISANGSLVATADSKVTLWSANHDSLAQIKVLELNFSHAMVFSLDNILAITTDDGIKLYNVKTDSFISTLLFGGTSIAFSPDCTRLVVGNFGGNVYLWDTRGIDASGPPSKEATPVTALALSRDCSRLACGFEDGTVELWGTSPTKRRIASHHKAHDGSVQALGFGPDGGLFASGSDDGTIQLWNGGDGALRGTLERPSGLRSGSVALSNSVLVAAEDRGVTLWSLDTLSHISTFIEYGTCTVSIAENNALIAVAHHRGVSLLDAENHRTITTFNVPHDYEIHTMTFIPDNLQLVAQSKDGVFLSFNLINKHIMKGATLEHLIQLPDISLWHGVPVWHCMDNSDNSDDLDEVRRHYFSASFSQHKSPVPVLWIPRHIRVKAWTQGSSMIALACEDGRVILLRLPNGHVS
ncbi:hypothetical protein M378DRAFT_794794 [Amanita muscaria Koide BX008]|uniref:NACHT domain-containing protein n=1 Tax=Amanita muscaria (strain Koide BX008) TaxID=946122 RepID=A0A0C2WL57_AMAMK|nr:hypothetical protein M378DRAFT_794794 [Amanita muscaria Koide BX008]